MIRSCYQCCCINEPVTFSYCVHLKLGHRFHALLKLCCDHDNAVTLSMDAFTDISPRVYSEFTIDQVLEIESK